MPRSKKASTVVDKTMDFGAVRNPIAGHAAFIEEKAGEWGGFGGDILTYLSDINNLQQFADLANNSVELAERLDPFLENAQAMMQALDQLNKGQITWYQLCKQYGSSVANAIASARKMNAEFQSEMQVVDAKDRSDMGRIEQKRKNALTEIAVQLAQDLEAEALRHEARISGITSRRQVSEERQAVTNSLREQRQGLLNRARYGSRALGGATAQEVIPVAQRQSQPQERSGGIWGGIRAAWNGLGDR